MLYVKQAHCRRKKITYTAKYKLSEHTVTEDIHEYCAVGNPSKLSAGSPIMLCFIASYQGAKQL